MPTTTRPKMPSVLLVLRLSVFFLSFSTFQLTLPCQIPVEPECGAMIMFQSRELHGIHSVLHGRRYVLTIWFTLDESRSRPTDGLRRRLEELISAAS
eukprot:m.62764 g.62764  ORF g.62764 m.62764 type:complete len:97 (-) comp49594_c0_seq4:507-797(-)